MNVRPSLLALLVAAALFAACGDSITAEHAAQGVSGSGGHAAASTGAGGHTTTSMGTGGSGGAANCATCTADERCDVLEPCLFPPVPYVCVPCQQRPYCGADGKIYDGDCAAILAGQSGGFGCTAPAGLYQCGSSYCNATNEDCGKFNPVPNAGFSESACVPCETVAGRACGDDGNVYDSACALLQAGHLRGTMCPGFVPCGLAICDTTTSTCTMGIIEDCGGGSPVVYCQLGVDAGG